MSVVAFVLSKKGRSNEKHVFNSHPTKKDVMIVDMVEMPIEQARITYRKYINEGFILTKPEPSKSEHSRLRRFRMAYQTEDEWLEGIERNAPPSDPIIENHPMFDDYEDLTNAGGRDDWDATDREEVETEDSPNY